MATKAKKKLGKSRSARPAARTSSAKKATTARKAKVPKRASKPEAIATPASLTEPLEEFIAATARVLELPLDRAWLPAIKTNLEVTLRLGASVAAFELPDETEPAPVFGT